LPAPKTNLQNRPNSEGAMSMEPFVFLTVFLFLTLLTFVARWLKTELEKISNKVQATRLPPLGQETPEAEGSLRSRSSSRDQQRGSLAPGLPLRSNKRKSLTVDLRTTTNLRQGIILMEILGPCRAFTPPAEFRNLE
jgi:hypothetical protein